ncbi:undecaprenyl/decaprenyl-phosphate alpha-N-acetylglucosaminyl 1-phosphate transferase [Patescibacteria group bacterium]|nr:undecaprenyl/decaprenyl-phosphate alpha-N-acetylglucosaminyl 1-phosphate transferase [Patescibacteria group bacterium]
MLYVLFFIIAFVVSLLAVPVVKKAAWRFKVLDMPNDPRKIHTRPIPFLGGFAIFISFFLTLLLYLKFFDHDFAVIPARFFWGMFIGASILMIGGFLDDKYSLKPRLQIISPVLAALAVVYSGIGVGITILSNPLGGHFNLAFSVFGISASAIFIFIFVLGMIYTTKFLDGMDGLASGISAIAGLTLFFLSLTPRISQSITASLAIIFTGAVVGFLVFNFNPASIFLGESGSTLLGFMLAVFSVLLGGKIATAILVMGIPILDVAWVIARRIWYGTSPFKADRKHLHFRLLDIGFSQRQTVLILYFIAAVFGVVTLFLQSLGKLIALLILIFVMACLAVASVVVYKEKTAAKSN